MSAKPHSSEVSALVFVNEDSAFVSASWDQCIRVHDSCMPTSSVGEQRSTDRDVKNDKFERVRAPSVMPVSGAHDGDNSQLTASVCLGLLATASIDLTVRVRYDVDVPTVCPHTLSGQEAVKKLVVIPFTLMLLAST